MSIVHDFRVDQNSPVGAKVGYVRIRKRGYYYRPDWAGYTKFKHEAGLYLREDAEEHITQTESVTIEEIQ